MRVRAGLVVLAFHLAGCDPEPVRSADVGRYWARLRASGNTLSDRGASFWFEYKEPSTVWSWAYKTPVRYAPPSSSGAFDAYVSGLKPGTAYEFRVCGVYDRTTEPICGDVESFTTKPPIALSRVVVDPQNPRLLAKAGGGQFVPWGNNYTEVNSRANLGSEFVGALVEDVVENPAAWSLLQTDLDRLVNVLPGAGDARANSARIFLQFRSLLTDAQTVNRRALVNVCKLVETFEDRGMYVMVTGLMSYVPADNPAWMSTQTDAQRWASQALWWNALAGALVHSPGVFAYDLTNEPHVSASSRVTNGYTRWHNEEADTRRCKNSSGAYAPCWAQSITDGTVSRTAQQRVELAAQWTQRMRQAIRYTSYFPNDQAHLITIGVAGFDFMRSPFNTPGVWQHVDFASIHLYPDRDDPNYPVPNQSPYSGDGTDQVNLAKSIAEGSGKPLVVSETFPFGQGPQLLMSQTCNLGYASGWIGQYDSRTYGAPHSSLQNSIGAALYDKWYFIQAAWGAEMKSGGCPDFIP